MRKLFVFVFLLGFTLGCTNVEQHREAIESLSANWDTMTQEVTNFSTEVTQEIANWQGELNNMRLAEGIQPDQGLMVQLDSLKSVGQKQGVAFKEIQGEVSTFVTAWETQTADVNALKSGLDNGKIAPELIAKIDSLNTSLIEAATTLENWELKLNETRNLNSNLSQKFSNLAHPKE